VEHALKLLRQEFDLAMALAGCPKIESIRRELVSLPGFS
jgi:isopentenyl diphosphate isomerase/L-lactate dehydrogenase-like FMN-dependent dehydrogenase